MSSKPGPESDADADAPPPHRALKAAVLIMGILLIVGFFVVFTTIIYRTVNSGGESRVSQRPSGPSYGNVEVSLPSGAIVGETELDGDRMIVRYTLNGATGYIVFDIKRGYEIGRFNLRPE